MLARRLLAAAAAVRKPALLPLRWLSSESSDSGRWNDLNEVVKELRLIALEQGLEGNQLPETKLLKELGHNALVTAIRKKHGGFVSIASKLGAPVDHESMEHHKRVSARERRRKKRQMHLAKHDFY